jgi:hypothetical protein
MKKKGATKKREGRVTKDMMKKLKAGKGYFASALIIF